MSIILNSKNDPKLSDDVPDQCPHCGQELTLWEQVLLSVDRMLICRNCWYRIILDALKGSVQSSDNKDEEAR